MPAHEMPPGRPPRIEDPAVATARAIERLRRLWTLARGEGPEADAARTIAERYEASTGLAYRVVSTSPIPRTFPPPPVLRIMGAGGLALLEWEGLLLEHVANSFGVLVVRDLDSIAFVGPAARVVDARTSCGELLGELLVAYQRRRPEEHRGAMPDQAFVMVPRWNGGAPIMHDVQGWRWEFSIAWAYSVSIELMKLFPRNMARPEDLTRGRAEAVIGELIAAGAKPGNDTGSRLPVHHTDARSAGTTEGGRAYIHATIERLRRYHG